MWTLQVTFKKKICPRSCKKYAGQENCAFKKKQDPDPEQDLAENGPDPQPCLYQHTVGSCYQIKLNLASY